MRGMEKALTQMFITLKNCFQFCAKTYFRKIVSITAWFFKKVPNFATQYAKWCWKCIFSVRKRLFCSALSGLISLKIWNFSSIKNSFCAIFCAFVEDQLRNKSDFLSFFVCGCKANKQSCGQKCWMRSKLKKEYTTSSTEKLAFFMLWCQKAGTSVFVGKRDILPNDTQN